MLVINLLLLQGTKRPHSASLRGHAASTSADVTAMLEESPRKKKLRVQLFKEKVKNRQKTQKIKVLGQSLKRHKKKIRSLKHVLKILEQKNFLTAENSPHFDNLGDIHQELIRRKLGKKLKYSPKLRQFAITLNFLSPNAYDFVRAEFETCLPHSSTISKWYQKVNAAPGFSTEAFSALKLKVQNSDRSVLCSVMVDEIAIRKNLEWDGTKFHGYVNFGAEVDDDRMSLAKEAFVLMAVCINGKWKIPIGYFFVDGLNGSQKRSLVEKGIRLCQDAGIKVVSLTFDGAPSNISMANMFGLKTDTDNIKTNFKIGNDNIYMYYDPCHMIKLVRNTIGEKKNLTDIDGLPIQWEYIKMLEELQENEGLHLGNKLRKAHINFFKQKMKVRLAVQLLSASVADALEYCQQKLGLEQFRGCEGTIKFIRIMNNIFDILNSRSLAAPNFKKAVNPGNIEKVKTFVDYAKKYISNLKFGDGEYVINSRRKTGFIGLIVCLESTLALYKELVHEQKHLIYFPVYKVSQDHLELFFSSIRSRSGWNNNPTARQFTASYKRLLLRAELRHGGMGNCIPLEQIGILTCSSTPTKTLPEHKINMSCPQLMESLAEETLDRFFRDYEYLSETLSQYSEEVVIYIAGFVAQHLQKVLKCEECISALIGDRDNFLHSLVTHKSRGGLTYPSKGVIKICKMAEIFLRVSEQENMLRKKNCVFHLTSKVISRCLGLDLFPTLNEHVLVDESNHIYHLTKAICSKYLNVRIHYIVKRKCEHLDPIRSQMTKLILFSGQ